MQGLRVFTRVDDCGIPRRVQSWCLNRERGSIGALLFNGARLYLSIMELGVENTVQPEELDDALDTFVAQHWSQLTARTA